MMEMKNSTQKALEKTEIHHYFLKNTEIRKNTEEWHVCVRYVLVKLSKFVQTST